MRIIWKFKPNFIAKGEEDARLRANGDDLVIIPKSDAQISALLGVLPQR